MAELALSQEQIVQNYYARQDTVKAYSTTNLFISEEKLFPKYFQPGSSILDLGCGAGRTSIDLARKGYKVIGIDFAPKMIESGKQMAESFSDLNLELLVGDATKLQYPDNSFDNVLFSFNGPEQIPGSKNREKVLRDVYKILRPGGYFIVTSRSGLAFASRRSIAWLIILSIFVYKRFFKGDKTWGGDYIHYTNPFKLKATAKKIGFDVCDFNSEENIIEDRKGSFLTNFSNTRILFYVLQKP